MPANPVKEAQEFVAGKKPKRVGEFSQKIYSQKDFKKLTTAHGLNSDPYYIILKNGNVFINGKTLQEDPCNQKITDHLIRDFTKLYHWSHGHAEKKSRGKGTASDILLEGDSFRMAKEFFAGSESTYGPGPILNDNLRDKIKNIPLEKIAKETLGCHEKAKTKVLGATYLLAVKELGGEELVDYSIKANQDSNRLIEPWLIKNSYETSS